MLRLDAPDPRGRRGQSAAVPRQRHVRDGDDRLKPAPFDYHRPEGLEEAVELLARYAGDGKAIAGGQSLGPLLNLRLATPAALVDLAGLAELDGIHEENGELRVGALTRQRAAEHDPLLRERCPLLAEALPWIGHAAIRNRGTVGGSLAHADPAAELPAVVTAVDATIEIAGDGHTRTSTPAELFLMPLVTSLEPDELIVGIRIPPPPPRLRCAWVELAPRHGDFALAGVAVALTLADDGSIEQARLALAGVGPVPIDARDAAAMLTAERPSEELWASAAEAAVAASDPRSDIHASADYRRRLVRVLVQRALRKATA